MPNAEIRETIIRPDSGGTVVQLQISDGPMPAELPGIAIQLTVRMPDYELPLLTQLQREAMKRTIEVMRQFVQNIAEIHQHQDYDVDPTTKS